MKIVVVFTIVVALTVFAVMAEPRISTGAERVIQDVTYSTIERFNLKMDLYYPQTWSFPYPVVIYVHAGEWTSRSKSGGAGMRDIPTLLAHGYVVAAVDYRLAPRWKFPAQIEDVKCAVRYLRLHADERGRAARHPPRNGGRGRVPRRLPLGGVEPGASGGRHVRPGRFLAVRVHRLGEGDVSVRGVQRNRSDLRPGEPGHLGFARRSAVSHPAR